MMKKKVFFTSLLFTICIYFFSCSSSSTNFSWKNPEHKNTVIKNVLCAAVMKDKDYKRICENMLNYSLYENNIKAVSTEDFVYLHNEPTTELLKEVIEENKFDYLFIVSFINKKSDKANYSAINYEEYFTKKLEIINHPDYKDIYWNTNAEVILFSLKTKKPVWAGIIKTIDDIWNEVFVELAEEVTKELKYAGIIKN